MSLDASDTEFSWLSGRGLGIWPCDGLEFGVGFERGDECRWSTDLRRPEVPVGVDEPGSLDRPEVAGRTEPAFAQITQAIHGTDETGIRVLRPPSGDERVGRDALSRTAGVGKMRSESAGRRLVE